MAHFSKGSAVPYRDIWLGGVPIRNTTARAFIRFIERRRPNSPQLAIGFVNQNFIVACRGLSPLAKADPQGILLLDDGIGVEIAARLLNGRGFTENLNGTDLIPLVLSEVKRDLSVFLIGGTPAAVERAASLIDKMPRRRIVGVVDGFSIWQREKEVVTAINHARPDVLLVGFGNPKQERWILEHRRELKVTTIFGVGALFDWMSGARRRAPLVMRRTGLEWLWRFALEPKRLWKRYTIQALLFFIIVWRNRDATVPLRGASDPTGGPAVEPQQGSGAYQPSVRQIS